jgi:glycosyltransferase involved in cell wall biosynthesis
MKSKLIILTRRFPYFKTEAFMESELPVIADVFKEIVIYPSESGSSLRRVPENVRVELSFENQYKRKIQRSLKTLFSKFFWSQILKNFKRGKLNIGYIFVFSSRVLAYMDFFRKNESDFKNALVYSYWLNEAPLAFAYINKKLNLDSILVARAHRFDVYEGGENLVPFWPEREFLLKNIDKVYAISENAKIYLDKLYHSNEKTVVAKLGVFDKQTISKASKPGVFHVVSVSRIDPVKRLDLMLFCLDNFAQMFKEVKIEWTHFGEGSLFNDLRDKLKKINSNNLKIELKGAVENKMIYEFYKQTAVDCFINLSSSEGIPVSIMEAQSFGIPTIATDVGGTSEIVTEGNGVLLKSDPTVEEVTNALILLYNQKPDRKLIKESWNKNFNAEINYKRFADELLKL